MPEAIITQAAAQTPTPLMKPVAPISPRINREKKCEGRLGHSTLDRETLIIIVATRQCVGEKHGVLRESPNPQGESGNGEWFEGRFVA